ncbi:hypothetical protein HDV03_000430 [Kappamyces sp. JEL0829]|nr:hypothetical protein HDV03_000430 [Kappamyces sp. JEL0829]
MSKLFARHRSEWLPFPFFYQNYFALSRPATVWGRLWKQCCLFCSFLWTKFISRPPKITARVDPESGMISVDRRDGWGDRTVQELYNHGGFGKAALSRGLPTWFQRHFDANYVPQGLAEKRMLEQFDQDAVDWFNSDASDDEPYYLMPEEAFFLAFGLDILELWDANGKMTVAEMWTYFRQVSAMHCNAAPAEPVSTNDFAVQYAVYHYFRSHGWTPRSGILFGVDWVLYQQGPQQVHSRHCVWIVPSTETRSALSLARHARVAHNVKKVLSGANDQSLVLCYVDIPSDLSSPRCLSGFAVSPVKVTRWNPDKERNP